MTKQAIEKLDNETDSRGGDSYRLQSEGSVGFIKIIVGPGHHYTTAIARRRIVATATDVENAPLIIPFQALYDRAPGPKEIDLVLSVSAINSMVYGNKPPRYTGPM